MEIALLSLCLMALIFLIYLMMNKRPVHDPLSELKGKFEQYEKKVEEFKLEWAKSHAGMDQYLKILSASQTELRAETGNLVKALRQPHVRGRWGEIQLKKVVEMAGMLEWVDFHTQETSVGEKRLRPDMIVKLPNSRQIVVDSKAPLQAYLEALEATTEEDKSLYLQQHAKQIKTHMLQLSQKSYWDQFPSTPEFVVLFLPGETFFSAALQQDPALIELGVSQKVLLATPTTLIALLRSVAYGWKEEKLTQNAHEISELGKELYKRTATLVKHFDSIRKGLESTTDAYNKAAASFESRVMVSVRKFKELGALAEEEIEAPKLVERLPKSIEVEKEEEEIEALAVKS